MKEKGHPSLGDGTRKNLKAKLQLEFGEYLHISPDKKGKLPVVPGSLSFQEIATAYVETKTELDLLKQNSIDKTKLIDQTASVLRSAVKNETKPSSWPIHPDDVMPGLFTAQSFCTGS